MMGRALVGATMLLAGVALPRGVSAQCEDETELRNTTRCTDGLGFIWQIERSGGTLTSGSNLAYDTFGGLCITTDLGLAGPCGAGTELVGVPSGALTTLTPRTGGSELHLFPARLGPTVPRRLWVRRRLFVPHGGTAGYLRHLDVIQNTGTLPLTVKVRAGTTRSRQTLGCDGDCRVSLTDTGSGALSAGQQWFVVEGRPGAEPVVGMVIGNGGAGTTTLVTQQPMAHPGSRPDWFLWEYEPVTLPPGGRVAYLHFQIQRESAALVAATARSLSTPTPADLIGIEPRLRRDIQNFLLPPPPNCGDGTFQPDEGEECDDGNDFDGDACTSECFEAVCGDGIVRVGTEECDDGNTSDADECTSRCTFSRCGDGVIDEGEQCDDGEDNSDVDVDACRETCVLAACGDGVLDSGETCDDGNVDENDECNPVCEPSRCGDGFIYHDGGEICDEGDDNGRFPGRCSFDCSGFAGRPDFGVPPGRPDAGTPDMGPADLGASEPGPDMSRSAATPPASEGCAATPARAPSLLLALLGLGWCRRRGSGPRPTQRA